MAVNDRRHDRIPDASHDPVPGVDATQGALPVWKEDIQDEMQQAVAMLDTLEKRIGKLVDDYQGHIGALPPRQMGDFLAEFETLSETVAQAQMLAAITQTSAYDARLSGMASRLTFATDEICSMDEKRLLAAMANPAVAAYAPWLAQARAMRGHRLDAETEAYLQKKDAVSTSAWSRCYDLVIDRGLDLNGTPVGFDEAIHAMQREKDARKRRKISRSLDETLQQKGGTLARIFNAVAAIRRVSDDWRDYSEAMERRATADLTDGGMADLFLEKMAAAYPVVTHPYFSAKAAQKGAAQLPLVEIEYPLSHAAGKSQAVKVYSWHEARDVILSSFAGFSKPLAEQAQRFFDEGWIDAVPAPDKEAYCLHVAGSHPRLSLSFEGRAEDVVLLARLLGSGVQQYAAAQTGHLNASIPAVTDDVVAVFCERLALQAILPDVTALQERRHLLDTVTGAMIRGISGEAAALQFEKDCHAHRREIGELTAEEISGLWLKSRQAYAGAALDSAEVNGSSGGSSGGTLWALRESLFKRPFSALTPVMSRAFALAVCEHAEAGAPRAAIVQAFDTLLTQKVARTPQVVAAMFGLNADDAGFWSKSVDGLKRQVDALQSVDRQIVAAREGKSALPANDSAPGRRTRKTVAGKKGPEMP